MRSVWRNTIGYHNGGHRYKNETHIFTLLIESKWCALFKNREGRINGGGPRATTIQSTFDGPVEFMEEINVRGLSGHGFRPFTAYTCARLARSMIKWSWILSQQTIAMNAADVFTRYQIHCDALFICINMHVTAILISSPGRFSNISVAKGNWWYFVFAFQTISSR